MQGPAASSQPAVAVLHPALGKHLRWWKALKTLMRVKWSPAGCSRLRWRATTASSQRAAGGTKQGPAGGGEDGLASAPQKAPPVLQAHLLPRTGGLGTTYICAKIIIIANSIYILHFPTKSS